MSDPIHPSDKELEDRLRDLGAKLQPDPEWQAKVWRRIDQRQRRRLAASVFAFGFLSVLIAVLACVGAGFLIGMLLS